MRESDSVHFKFIPPPSYNGIQDGAWKNFPFSYRTSPYPIIPYNILYKIRTKFRMGWFLQVLIWLLYFIPPIQYDEKVLEGRVNKVIASIWSWEVYHNVGWLERWLLPQVKREKLELCLSPINTISKIVHDTRTDISYPWMNGPWKSKFGCQSVQKSSTIRRALDQELVQLNSSSAAGYCVPSSAWALRIPSPLYPTTNAKCSKPSLAEHPPRH